VEDWVRGDGTDYEVRGKEESCRRGMVKSKCSPCRPGQIGEEWPLITQGCGVRDGFFRCRAR